VVETVGRVFAAVPLPSEIRLALADQIASLNIPGKLVPAESWHLTLRFLGSIDQVTYERFLHALSDVEDRGRFPMRLSGFGGFPNTNRATVVWVGFSDGVEGLLGLNEIAESAAQTAGLEPEDRPYQPHLTLSRVRPPTSVADLLDTSLDLRWTATEVVVFQSHLGRGGARYEPLERFALAAI